MECLERIWLALGVGENGYLNKPELLRLCQHVGVHASEEDIAELFEGLNVDGDGRVSFDELVQLFHSSKLDFRGDDVAVETGGPAGGDTASSTDRPRPQDDSGLSISDSSPASSLSCRAFSTIFSEIDPFCTGTVSWDALCRWWEDHGVEDAPALLKALGYDPPDGWNASTPSHAHTHGNGSINGRNPHLKTLAALRGRSMSAGSPGETIALSSISRKLEDAFTFALQSMAKKSNPEHSLLVAALLSYREYCSFLKGDVDVATKQVEKVRQDLVEANERATALAQEIDEQNARVEKLERERITELEHEYGERLRHLRRQLDEARDQARKEARVADENAVQLEEAKAEKQKLEEKVCALKEDLDNVRETCDDLRENLSEKTDENNQLVAQLQRFENACEEDRLKALEEAGETSKKLRELDLLREEVARLRTENNRLIDENDVLAQQAERNTSASCSALQQRWPDIMSGVLLDGMSCSSQSSEASPVTSPVKKRLARAKSFGGSNKDMSVATRLRRKSLVARAPSLSQELCLELGNPTPTPPTSEAELDVERDADEASEPEKRSILVQVNGQDISTPTDDPKIAGILCRLENVIMELQSCSEVEACSLRDISEVNICSDVGKSVETTDGECSTDLTSAELEEKLKVADDSTKYITQLEEGKAELASKLDFLQAEYDDSEDYWQQKMEEERQYYEGHINSLSEKLNSLLNEFQIKLAEYEEASTSSGQKEGGAKGGKVEESLQQSSLPTIFETDYEIQVLEAEADAKKWEQLYNEAEEEKDQLEAHTREIVASLNSEWCECISRIYSEMQARIDTLSSRIESLLAALPKIKSASVSWKMRAWEAEGMVHDLETDRVVAEDEKRAMQDRLKEAEPSHKEIERLAKKLWQEETKARHLESSLRSQKDHASKIINEMNRQHSAEVQELQQLLASTRARLQEQISKFHGAASSTSSLPTATKNAALGYQHQFSPKHETQLRTGQVLQEMQAQNERLSSSMKALNGTIGNRPEGASPRRHRGGGQSQDDSSAHWGYRRQEEYYFQPIHHPQPFFIATQQFHYQNAGPWSLPPPMSAPLSPFRRPPNPQMAPVQGPSSASSWAVFNPHGHGHGFSIPPGHAASVQQQQQHQQQQQIRRKRPPPAPPGYVHVSQPGDTYI